MRQFPLARSVSRLATRACRPVNLRCRFNVPNVKRSLKASTAPGAGDVGAARTPEHTAAVREHVERASKLLDEMLEEIMSEMFVDQATSYISDEAAALSEAEAIRNAVVQRIEFLDANFLAALNGYIEASKGKGGEELLPLLELMRIEILYQVALRLPSAARVLNRTLQEMDKDLRLDVLRSALGGGAADLPGCDADSLSSASTQFIDDMEEQEVVADRQLLARLCLVREEVRWLSIETNFTASGVRARDGGEASTSASEVDSSKQPTGEAPAGGHEGAPHFFRSNVPQRPATFINQLVAINEPHMRVGLMSRAFCEDWEGAAPRQKPQSSAQKGQPDWVRPGRFMLTLHAMMQNMEAADSASSAAGLGKGLMKRMADIQMEAINVLDRLQRGQLKPL